MVTACGGTPTQPDQRVAGHWTGMAPWGTVEMTIVQSRDSLAGTCLVRATIADPCTLAGAVSGDAIQLTLTFSSAGIVNVWGVFDRSGWMLLSWNGAAVRLDRGPTNIY